MIVVNNKNMEYIILEDVEFRHDGQAEQHSPAAVDVQQHAALAAQPAVPRIAPMISFFCQAK